MDIDYLVNFKEAIPMLARWFYEEWSYLYPERTLADVERAITERTNTDTIPLALVAVDAGKVVGTVCLKLHDMDTHIHWSPWLAGLYVAKQYRKKGIGSALVQAIERKASELGIRKLYLCTPESEAFYSKRGWSLIAQVDYHGCPVSLMEKHIAR